MYPAQYFGSRNLASGDSVWFIPRALCPPADAVHLLYSIFSPEACLAEHLQSHGTGVQKPVASRIQGRTPGQAYCVHFVLCLLGALVLVLLLLVVPTAFVILWSRAYVHPGRLGCSWFQQAEFYSFPVPSLSLWFVDGVSSLISDPCVFERFPLMLVVIGLVLLSGLLTAPLFNLLSVFYFQNRLFRCLILAVSFILMPVGILSRVILQKECPIPVS
jgi:hypothetical protein